MKNIKSERGQSLVELSISIVILLYLLSGAVEFGIAFFQFVQLRDAAQEGALYGSLNPTMLTGMSTDTVERRVRNSSSSPIDLADTSKVTVTSTIIGSACEGNGIEVRVSYDHKVFMPFIPQILGTTTIPLNATVTDTILSPVCP
jgi:Flp pilus assembly protein TadG